MANQLDPSVQIKRNEAPSQSGGWDHYTLAGIKYDSGSHWVLGSESLLVTVIVISATLSHILSNVLSKSEYRDLMEAIATFVGVGQGKRALIYLRVHWSELRNFQRLAHVRLGYKGCRFCLVRDRCCVAAVW